MGFFSPNPAKQKQIELQNILFNTNEKKLMVTPEFLHNMAVNYASKRMKTVNKMNSGLVSTKTPRHFFAYYDIMMQNLDELILIEPYHEFKNPVPSVFKNMINEKMNKYIEAMINRTWKEANHKFGLGLDGKRDPLLYGPVLDDILRFRDRYPEVLLEHISNSFYKSVYGVSFLEMEERQAAAEAVTEDIENVDGAEHGDIPDPDDGLSLHEEAENEQNAE